MPQQRARGNVQWNLSRGMWSAQEIENQINVLERLVKKLAIQTFSKSLKHKAILFQVDNMVALTYLLKMGQYPEFKISPISKRNMISFSPMWGHSYCRVHSHQTERDSRFVVKKQFGLLGIEAGSPVISENLPTKGTQETDLFASRLSHQIKTYFSWRPDLLSQVANAFQQNLFHKSRFTHFT